MTRLLRTLEVPLLVAVPVALAAAALFQFDQSALFTFVVALVAVGMLFAGFEAETLRSARFSAVKCSS